MTELRIVSQPSDARPITSEEFKPKAARDAHVYFDNDIGEHAPLGAAKLAAMLAD